MASRALQIAPRNLSRKPSFIHRVFSSSSTSNDADNNNSKLASPPSPISFQELEVSPEGKPSFDAIRERLKQLLSSSSTEGGQTKGKTEVPSLSASKDSLRLRPVDSDDALPMSVFGKDMRDSLVRSKISEDEKAKKFSRMSQNVEISRANLTDPIQRKHFIDLCLQEANKGFRSSGGLKSSAWPRIAEELEKLLGKRFASKQLKNEWDYMKRQYLIWSKMMTMTGHGYNSVTKTFDWPAEKWEEYLQKYPEAKQFRFKPLANMEELEALFGGVLAIGSKNWSSGGVIASGVEESSTHSTSMASETSISLEEDENLPRNTNDEVEGSKKKQKKGKKEQNQEEMNRIINVLENFEGPSVKECMKILKKLLTYEDPLYYVAINGFCKKKEYREVWVEMESDEERMGWIQNLRK
ncbi:L10-interacting MYB domain-containing protein-like isoform X2 [Vitis riparia]|uniref:L10-interacting MYB domain-containing protein-like isoform X2 n=1 Tax=Vitis riparia TaxID=96939 RepID=UPI00155ACD01|nr:L10-interacting MYB domain-containing protein-like isoform X2 [Vitis riparia]